MATCWSDGAIPPFVPSICSVFDIHESPIKTTSLPSPLPRSGWGGGRIPPSAATAPPSPAPPSAAMFGEAPPSRGPPLEGPFPEPPLAPPEPADPDVAPDAGGSGGPEVGGGPEPER